MRAAALTVLGCALLIALSPLLPWVSADAGPTSAGWNLLAVPVACGVLAICLLVIVAGALTALSGIAVGLELAGLGALALVLQIALFAGPVEVAAWLLPLDLVSPALRRAAGDAGVGLSVGFGAWTALAAALAAFVVATTSIRSAAGAALAKIGSRRAKLLSLLALALAALTLLRQQTWMEAAIGGRDVGLDGGTLPFIAGMTGAASALLAGGIGLVGYGRVELGALMAALAGWLFNFTAALTIATGRALADLEVRAASTATAVWLVFALGLGVAALAATLLREEGRR